MRALVLLALPVLALGACSKPDSAPSATDTTAATASDAASPAAAMASPMAAPDGATYVAKAGASDMFEIASSKAILAKTQSADVKKFAHMMITAHTESTAKIKAAAKAAGMMPKPPMMDADQTAMLDAIKKADGSAADAEYIADQKKGHEAALALHQAYAAGGDTPSLKAAAGDIVPVVQSHIAMLKAMPGS